MNLVDSGLYTSNTFGIIAPLPMIYTNALIVGNVSHYYTALGILKNILQF